MFLKVEMSMFFWRRKEHLMLYFFDVGVKDVARCGQGLSLEAASCSKFCSVVITLWSKDIWRFIVIQATRHLASVVQVLLAHSHT